MLNEKLNTKLNETLYMLLNKGIYGTYDKSYDRTIFWYINNQNNIPEDVILDYVYGCKDNSTEESAIGEYELDLIVKALIDKSIVLDWTEDYGYYVVPLDFKQITRLNEVFNIKEFYSYQPAFLVEENTIRLELRPEDKDNYNCILERVKTLIPDEKLDYARYDYDEDEEAPVIDIVLNPQDIGDNAIINHILFDNVISMKVKEVTDND